MNRDLAKMCLTAIISLLAVIVCCVVFSSCRTQYIPVETVKTEYRYIDRVQHDSIYFKDSVRYYMKGDTVFQDKYVREYKYLYINRVDSFTKTDSIAVPYPIERKLNRWESMKMELGGWAFGGFIVMTLVVVGWFVFRWRRK